MARKKEVDKNCDTCGYWRGYSFYGVCHRCDDNYSEWIQPVKRTKQKNTANDGRSK